ncbi:VOC family protein [Paenibacillus sp. R14(2021)]|uniref:VOC family protein n=1 Tax=Paenibacillus sp. R14(2021) TaxID=2859228 RepID=UPI001C612CCF|nr:VOC family protein [Paenibacillus sp. R14(2021)]
MPQLRPYIYSENAIVQAEFYVNALGGEIVSVQTFGDMPGGSQADKDRVMHLVAQAAGLTFYLADSGSVHRGSGLDLTLEFETEAAAAQAFDKLAVGGEILMPFERMFWGSMFGRLTDRFGVRWQIAVQAEI